MALNLWKLAGKATSYSPLPAFTDLSVGINEYTISFRAKSPTSTTLWVRLTSGLYSNVFALTTDFKSYSFTFRSNGNDTFRLQDHANKGDIIIDSIELVQKPIPKMTINGIDGFKSGKWSLHANATVIDDETLVLNATAGGQENSLTLPVEPSKTYTIAIKDSYGWLNMSTLTSGKATINGSFLFGAINPSYSSSFTTPSNCYFVKLDFNSYGVYPTVNTFKRPMLNLGSIPAPYEKKRGDRMVMPIAKGNLFDGNLESGTISNGNTVPDSTKIRTINFIPIKPNTAYTIIKKPTTLKWFTVHCYSFSKTWTRFVVDTTQTNITFTTGSDEYFLKLKFDDSVSEIQNCNFMLTEGTTAQPYQPYAVQVNKKPLKYVPKKNLIPTDVGAWEQGSFDSYNANISITTRLRMVNSIPSVSGKVYTFSCASGFEMTAYSGSDVANTSWGNPITFTSNGSKGIRLAVRKTDQANIVASEIANVKPQLEEGTVSTPYEPYTPVLPRAKTGLAFNGVTDYLQLPSMTMDSIEIDCLIDSVQQTFSALLDSNDRPNSWFSFGGMGTDVSSVKIGENSYSNLTSVPRNTRQKMKISFKSAQTLSAILFTSKSARLVDTTKATLYKVTCYLAGQVVASYDFEKPSNIVGDKVLQNAKNLIPSFEDARWMLHSNFKVLGKDVGRLEATAGQQDSFIILDITPNVPYRLSLPSQSTSQYISIVDGNNASWVTDTAGAYNPRTFTPTTSKIKVILRGDVAKSYDFIKPQLYQLDSKEGTIVGTPKPLKKTSKRSYYRKR